MSERKHALLSPSASNIWLNCPKSARLSEDIPDQETDYARQGICAHSLCEYKLRKALGLESEDPRSNLEFLDEEMERNSDEYVQFVLGMLNKEKLFCSDPAILIEQRLDFSKWVPEGFGYGDCVIIADGRLTVIDYKNGEGVLVKASGNTQLMCYALGALSLADGLYSIDTITMAIFQPRRENVSTWTIDSKELLSWAEDTLAPAAKKAFEGNGGFKAGEHCRFCRARNTCRARAEHNLELARYDFAMADTLDDEEVAEILSKVDELVSWASDIKEYALNEALGGRHYEGFKVVAGRSVRKYTDDSQVASAVKEAGFEPYEKSLLGITAMTKLLGKKKFEDILGDLVFKAPGKPVLVPVTDKRPELNSAITDFNDTEV